MLCIGDVQLPYRVGLGDWLAGLVHAFEAAGIRTAKVDARLLLAHALGLTNNQFDANSARLVTTEEGARVKDMAQRRLEREPLSRIIGVRKFYGRSFDLVPAILDPRRDTELLISAVLNIVKAEGWENAPLEILDLGTGSGCILLSLLSELKLALGLGVDLSAEALDCAKHNAAKLRVAERCRFRIANWLQGVSGCFQIVVANPPYMTDEAITALPSEAGVYDPKLALDGGADGLDAYRSILPGLKNVLSPGGWVAFQVGEGQAETVARMALYHGLEADNRQLCIRQDGLGIERVFAGKWSGAV